jgi:ATP-dependent helicase Lhr and Lhr-like helicase
LRTTGSLRTCGLDERRKSGVRVGRGWQGVQIGVRGVASNVMGGWHTGEMDSPGALDGFSAATRAWFEGAFAVPTQAQAQAWAAISKGQDTLVVAPTGSGKTLAAFLWALDRLAAAPVPADKKRRTRVLYVSPLKALAVDIERNLRSPLTGIRQAAQRLGLPEPDIDVAVRTGDTAAEDRRRLATRPPDILITTPESLFLLLTSQARETLRDVETVIVDEIHAVAGTKRGAHLALSLERLDALRRAAGEDGAAAADGRAQRVGLSATVRPAAEVATFLGGAHPVTVVQPPSAKRIDLEVVVPVEDMRDLSDMPAKPDSTGNDDPMPRRSIWPHVEERVLDLIQAHRSTIVFANSRRLAERLCGRLNELATERAFLAAGGDGDGAGLEYGADLAGADGGAGGTYRSMDDGGRYFEGERDEGWGDAERGPVTRPGASSAMGGTFLPQGAGGTYDMGTGRAGASSGMGRAFLPQQAGGMYDVGTGAGDGSVVIARAHHGSVSRQERSEIEEALKAGRLPAVVATSSLELGIDMGAVDLVIQVESPPSVASGLQRVGRAGHNVGDVSRGVIFPKYAADLVQAAVVADRMRDGAIEELRIPRNPLDVLAQQIVAMAALDDWPVDDLEAVIRRAAPFATLTRSVLEAVLDMLAGRYPGEEFAGLRPRVVWDRVAGVLRGRPGAQRLAVTSGGTIPDRGYFGVFLPSAGESSRSPRRVGELDEEMVYESRVGDVFVLGASSWRIEDITPDRVLVLPAPGQPGKLPFWHGDTPGRPAELGRAIGAKLRALSALPSQEAMASLAASGLDPLAAGNLVSYLSDQQDATGRVPDDRTLVVERFRDELGDWRVVLHSPYGDRVHAPWALAITARLRERYGGMDVQALHTDDGIIIRVPDSDEPPPAGIALIDPEDIGDIITAEVGGSALFASRFRECAARALLLPRRQPGRRTPLWQQRQRSAQLLEIASAFPGFPITLETVRECLQDVFDVPALAEVLRDLAARKIRLVEVETVAPSPFARNLMFRYVGAFMYEGDAPLAERRAQALALDPALLAELLGTEGLRELLDPAVVAETEADLQHLSEGRRCRDAEAVADLLRTSGPLTAAEVAARCTVPDPAGWLAGLSATRRIIAVRVAGQDMWAAVEDAGRLRDALGVALPVGIPEAFTSVLADPLGDLMARWARTHGPFGAVELAARYGLGVAVVGTALRRLAAEGRVAEGEFIAVLHGTQWCDSGVLRMLRRRTLARLRKEAEPVPPATLGRFLPAWHGIGSGSRRVRADAGAVLEAVERLAGAPVPASALETLVLPGRVPGYSPALLDELTAAGEVVWAGAGSVGSGDGWLVLAPAESAPLLLPEPDSLSMTPLHGAVLTALAGGGGMFFRMLSDRVATVLDGHPADDGDLVAALWDLTWAGLVSNDTLAPLRMVLSGGAPSRRQAAPRRASGSTFAADLRQARDALGGDDGGASGGGASGPGYGGAGYSGSAPGVFNPRPAGRSGFAGGYGGGSRYGRGPRRAAMPTRTGPPSVTGRWSLLPERYGLPDGFTGGVARGTEAASGADPGAVTMRAHALALTLLDRHGVVTRGAVAAERIPGGFAAVYPVLRAMEETGQCRRGYFVEGLGGAQFALPGAVDRMRALAEDTVKAVTGEAEHAAGTAGTGAGADSRRAVVLAAADPAQPYGAALPWPSRPEETASSHRPGRKAGAVVVLCGGDLALYVERGGKTLLSWTEDPAALELSAAALAGAVRDGALGRMTVEKADGGVVAFDSPLTRALESAGFRHTPRGLRLRG